MRVPFPLLSVGGAPMAEPYNSYIKLMSWVDLDVSGVLPLNCFSDEPLDHFDKLVTATFFFPLTVFLLLVAVFRPIEWGKWSLKDATARAKARRDVEFWFIQIMLLGKTLLYC